MVARLTFLEHDPILMFKMNNVIGLTTVTSPRDNVWGKQQQSQFK